MFSVFVQCFSLFFFICWADSRRIFLCHNEVFHCSLRKKDRRNIVILGIHPFVHIQVICQGSETCLCSLMYEDTSQSISVVHGTSGFNLSTLSSDSKSQTAPFRMLPHEKRRTIPGSCATSDRWKTKLQARSHPEHFSRPAAVTSERSKRNEKKAVGLTEAKEFLSLNGKYHVHASYCTPSFWNLAWVHELFWYKFTTTSLLKTNMLHNVKRLCICRKKNAQE